MRQDAAPSGKEEAMRRVRRRKSKTSRDGVVEMQTGSGRKKRRKPINRVWYLMLTWSTYIFSLSPLKRDKDVLRMGRSRRRVGV